MNLEKINFFETIQNLKKKNVFYRSCLDETYIEYLTKYNFDKSFENLSFKISDGKDFLNAFITNEISVNDNTISFYGDPGFVVFNKLNKKLLKIFFTYMRKLIQVKNIKKVNFVYSAEFQKEIKNMEFLPGFIDKISINKIIDLNKNIDLIFKQFKPSLKTTLNKKYKNLVYKVIDSTNYDNEISKMRVMHNEVSGKKTRSDETWLINEKMIKQNKAFLVEITNNGKVISYSFFFVNFLSNYFSSCTYRNYFKEFINLTHQSIFEAIKYLQTKEKNYFTLGETKIIYSKNEVSQKEKNITIFKNSFGGDKFVNFYLSKFDDKFFDFI